MSRDLQASGERVAVAYITRAKGVRGDVKAEVLTHSLDRFDELSELVLQKDDRPDLAVKLDYWRAERPGVLLKFAGIDSPEAARERLVGGYLTVAPGQIPSLPEDTYYIFELIGCAVEDEAGSNLGEIADVLQMPSTDVYQVRGPLGEILIPAVGDFIVAISIPDRRVVVRGIEELLKAR